MSKQRLDRRDWIDIHCPCGNILEIKKSDISQYQLERRVVEQKYFLYRGKQRVNIICSFDCAKHMLPNGLDIGDSIRLHIRKHQFE